MDNKVEKLTRVFLKIREARDKLRAEFKQEDDSLTEQMDMVKSAMLEFCKSEGLDSVRTEAGTFFRQTKVKYWTSDWESMNAFIKEHDVPEFYEKRLSQKVVKEFLEDNPDLMPKGLNVSSEYTVTVRKPSK